VKSVLKSKEVDRSKLINPICKRSLIISKEKEEKERNFKNFYNIISRNSTTYNIKPRDPLHISIISNTLK
jgi:hypothetical protein